MSSILDGMQVTPLFRTNLDVMVLSGKNRTKHRECGDLEMDAIECLESYGATRGKKICEKYIRDYQECFYQFIQTKRVAVMKRERIKQVIRGERKFFEVYDNIQPPRDSFQTGPFYN